MFAVAGVSGRTGAATAEALLKLGEKVRVIVRREEQGEVWLRRHAEVAVADLTDTPALTRALTGMKGVYLLVPPNPTAADYVADRAAFFDKVVAAVKASGIKRVALLSSVGAQHPAGTGPVVALHNAEKALKGVAPQLTFVRAASFVENWAPLAMAALETGELPHFGHTHVKYPQVCAHDIGVAAAKGLTNDAVGTHIIELVGKENWSADDVAEVLASLLATPVQAVERSLDQAKGILMANGAPEPWANLLVEMYQAAARGHLIFSHPHQLTRGTTTLYDALKPVL